MNHLDQRELKTHVTILGWLNIASGLFFLIMGLFVFFLLTAVGVATGDTEALPILVVVGTFVGGLMGTLALPSLLAGYGLLRRKNWGRILTVIVAALNLMNIPVGTALGIYAFWVLFQQEATSYFMIPKSA